MLKARLRLALRAERALGMQVVPLEIDIESAPASSPIVQERSAKPALGIQREANVKTVAPVPGKPGAIIVPAVLPMAGAFTSPVLSTEEKRLKLTAMDREEVSICVKCRLCETRTKTVFGEGDVDAKIFFIGEGPGENEDLQGRPFVGRAGELLDRMIAGMGLKREQVFIANIVKCRPPQNREPATDETLACTPYLERQLEIIRPRVIVTLGKPAAHHMLQVKTPISKMRGLWQEWRGIRLMPTFHPAYILRNYTEQTRRQVWSDLQQVMDEVGLPRKKSV
jgi:DNA polymerase